jgi:hypothetical protein
MNTVITPVYEGPDKKFVGYDYNDELGDKVIMSLMRNNVFVPNIERVIYNTSKSEDGSWVLQTEVQFVDGTKSVVKNSKLDNIKVEKVEVKLDDGTVCGKVDTATVESREIGLVYAIFKRIICNYDTEGNNAGLVKSTGLIKFFKNIKDRTIVGEIHSKKLKAQKEREKEMSKQKTDDRGSVISEDKPLKISKKKSFRDALRDITNVVNKLAEVVNTTNKCKCEDTPKKEAPVKPKSKSKKK